ncbi:MAG: UDP-N-acetylglucosamine 2-epimerase (non-hydrolyzing) [Bacillota bacterium]|nr:UDP-N-acetylglucosamine 2-epimerase (non-hydrolyzing) [Bacillota bacterium]
MKIVTVVGARPQFIKAAMVSRAFNKYDSVTEYVIHTGQHYDDNLSDVFFRELELPLPNINLGVGSGNHGNQTGNMLIKIEEVLLEQKPDWVLVYGDTNSTLAGALAAVKLHIPVAHVEAGLRSYNRRMPEETNRVLTDHSSDLLFAPTDTACNNLLREGISKDHIKVIGDVMYDAALFYARKAENFSQIMGNLGLSEKNYILATLHRAENTDDKKRLETIIDGFNAVADDMMVVFPIHPRTKDKLRQYNLLGMISPDIMVIEPVGYLDMIILEKNAILIATDSGGVQKEAYFYKVPSVTLRNETEWTELIEMRWNRLCPPVNGQQIRDCIFEAIGSEGNDIDMYGSGNAADRIASDIIFKD